ncbi:hypothetical protein BKA93DRAFT_822237 [Sparassis latifolia]
MTLVNSKTSPPPFPLGYGSLSALASPHLVFPHRYKSTPPGHALVYEPAPARDFKESPLQVHTSAPLRTHSLLVRRRGAGALALDRLDRSADAPVAGPRADEHQSSFASARLGRHARTSRRVRTTGRVPQRVVVTRLYTARISPIVTVLPSERPTQPVGLALLATGHPSRARHAREDLHKKKGGTPIYGSSARGVSVLAPLDDLAVVETGAPWVTGRDAGHDGGNAALTASPLYLAQIWRMTGSGCAHISNVQTHTRLESARVAYLGHSRVNIRAPQRAAGVASTRGMYSSTCSAPGPHRSPTKRATSAGLPASGTQAMSQPEHFVLVPPP